MFGASGNNTIPLNEETSASIAELVAVSADAGQESKWKEDHEEGQLSVDVLDSGEDLVIMATMAGARPEDVEVHLQNDFLTIRGKRYAPVTQAAHYFNQECYWGKFSRTVVLPVDVKGDSVRSEYRNGVLTIRLPKAKVTENIPIMVIEE